MLGYAKDNIEILKKSIEYLEVYNTIREKVNGNTE